MRYIKFWFDIGYITGADEWCVAYKEPIAEAIIMNDGENLFYQHCEDYSYLFMADFDEDNDNGEEDYDSVYNDYIDNWCSWGYEDISEEEYMQAKEDGYAY